MYYALFATHALHLLFFLVLRPSCSLAKSVDSAIHSALIALFSLALALNSSAPSLSRAMISALMQCFPFVGGVALLHTVTVFFLKRRFQPEDAATVTKYTANEPQQPEVVEHGDGDPLFDQEALLNPLNCSDGEDMVFKEGQEDL